MSAVPEDRPGADVPDLPGPDAPVAPEAPDPTDPDPDVDEPWHPHDPSDPSPVAPNPSPGTGDDPQPRRDLAGRVAVDGWATTPR